MFNYHMGGRHLDRQPPLSFLLFNRKFIGVEIRHLESSILSDALLSLILLTQEVPHFRVAERRLEVL